MRGLQGESPTYEWDNLRLSLYFGIEWFFKVSVDRDPNVLMFSGSLFQVVAILLFTNCSSSVEVIGVLCMS